MDYAIKDTTLTAIADAIRGCVGEYSYLDAPTSQPYEISLDTREIESFKSVGNRYYYLPSIDIREIFKDRYDEIKQLYYEVSYTASVGDYTEAQFTILFDECVEPDKTYNTRGLGVSATSPIENVVTGLITINKTAPYRRFGAYIKNTFNQSYYLVAHLKLWACDAYGRFIELKYLTPLEMVDEINGLDAIPSSAFTIGGDCAYRFAYNGWNWFIDTVGDKITTNDITSIKYMFYYNQALKKIPFELNCSNSNYGLESVFQYCKALKTLPIINNVQFGTSSSGTLYNFCADSGIEEIPEGYGDNWNWDGLHNNTYQNAVSNVLPSAIRKIYPGFLKQLWTKSYNNQYVPSTFTTLKELIGYPVPQITATSNMYSKYKKYYSIKRFVFDTDNGVPYVVNWKSQTLNLSNNSSNMAFGYTNGDGNINTLDSSKRITNDASYQALKDDEEAWTSLADYSFYNHDSAVETINSLPDTSAYIATNGGTNTIQFTGVAGAKTDGGAINTLTEEEIAVATAKGWTVSLV